MNNVDQVNMMSLLLSVVLLYWLHGEEEAMVGTLARDVVLLMVMKLMADQAYWEWTLEL